MELLPTVARTTRGPVSANPITPHAESHELNGDDPVLGQVRLLEVVETSTPVQYDYAGGGVSNWQEITALTTTVRSRGGKLRIVFGSTITVWNDNTSGTNDQHFQIRPSVGGTTLAAVEFYMTQPASILGSFVNVPFQMTWFYTVNPGEYEIMLEVDSPWMLGHITVPGVTSFGTDDPAAFLQIEELLPIRRG